jgi:Poly(ADP-ribose) polymerase catalytic domain
MHSQRCPAYWPRGPWFLGLGDQNGTEYKMRKTVVRGVGGSPDKKRTSLREGDFRKKGKGEDFTEVLEGELRRVMDTDFWTCELPEDSGMSRALHGYLNESAHNHPYTTKRHEGARLAAGGDFNSTAVRQYLNPKFKTPAFKEGTYEISRILVIYNPDRWNKYVAFRTTYRAEMPTNEGNPLLNQIRWANSGSETGGGASNFPVIDSLIGECFLVHGTRGANMKLIAQHGFGPEHCTYRKSHWSGFGSLGEGSYLSDNLAKSATYCDCPKCHCHGPCACLDGDGNPVERVAIIARAIIPSDSIGYHKRLSNKAKHLNLVGADERKHRRPMSESGEPLEVPDPKGAPMFIGLTSNRKRAPWPNNVFLVRKKDIIYPEFAVFFRWPSASLRQHLTQGESKG